jgi:hypothetical protein
VFGVAASIAVVAEESKTLSASGAYCYFQKAACPYQYSVHSQIVKGGSRLFSSEAVSIAVSSDILLFFDLMPFFEVKSIYYTYMEFLSGMVCSPVVDHHADRAESFCCWSPSRSRT